MQCVRQLKSKSFPDYIALEPGSKSIYTVSEVPFKFISDTENSIVEEKKIDQSKYYSSQIIACLIQYFLGVLSKSGI